jgi:uncharacterized protein YbjQ (UPF0145 family)
MSTASTLMELGFKVLARVAEAISRIMKMKDREAAVRALQRLEKHAAQIDADAIAQDEVGRMVRERERDDG